ncbi:MAG: ferredoxin--NADP reductase [Methylococcaceae bacterium]
MPQLKENVTRPEILLEATVTGNREIVPGVHLISWKRDHYFEPGMVIKLTVNKDIVPRIYSICSGNQEEEIRVLFGIKEEGLLTPLLSKTGIGDIVWVSEPYGSFLDNKKPAWWIATGTGIAPFYSMFRSGISDNRTLIQGSRSLNQFYFEDEFQKAMSDRYIRCCAHEPSSDVFPGRVTQYLQQIDKLPADIYYYLCGKAIMVVEVRDLLISKGIPYEHILSEIYF